MEIAEDTDWLNLVLLLCAPPVEVLSNEGCYR